jgi:two-component system chemotaxis response regulator CheY
MNILIIDDEFEVRNYLKELLRPYGKCDTAVTGVEAIEMFTSALDENKPYDLICLDLMLPHTDGEESLKKIRIIEKERGIDKARSVKIIVVSAVHEPAVLEDAVQNWGADSYIIKPFPAKKFFDELANLGLLDSSETF